MNSGRRRQCRREMTLRPPQRRRWCRPNRQGKRQETKLQTSLNADECRLIDMTAIVTGVAPHSNGPSSPRARCDAMNDL